MNEKRIYKRYSQSFKEEAVGLVTEQGYSVAEAAQSLGIRPNQLYDWKAKLEALNEGSALSVDERAELKNLRKGISINLALVYSGRSFGRELSYATEFRRS